MNPKARTTSENLIEFRDVFFSAHRGATGEIISGVSLTVPHGETLVLLGRSGSGKTTLLKLINGMLAPTRGEVLVQQRCTTDWNLIQLRRSIGYVIQDAGLFPHHRRRKRRPDTYARKMVKRPHRGSRRGTVAAGRIGSD